MRRRSRLDSHHYQGGTINPWPLIAFVIAAMKHIQNKQRFLRPRPFPFYHFELLADHPAYCSSSQRDSHRRTKTSNHPTILPRKQIARRSLSANTIPYIYRPSSVGRFTSECHAKHHLLQTLPTVVHPTRLTEGGLNHFNPVRVEELEIQVKGNLRRVR